MYIDVNIEATACAHSADTYENQAMVNKILQKLTKVVASANVNIHDKMKFESTKYRIALAQAVPP